jgi:hypothetical protein
MTNKRSANVSEFSVLREEEARGLPREESSRFRLRVPLHWKSPIFQNPYAKEVEHRIVDRFLCLGCPPKEIERVEKFDVAGYVGIPFPGMDPEYTVRIGKYLSMWLLWDDLQIESLQNRWRIREDHILDNRPLEDATRFDRGWLQLFREFAARRSRRWIRDLCGEMGLWNDAAVREAKIMERSREGEHLIRFATQLDMRIATIGMNGTFGLFEDAYDFELPPEVHADPNVRKLKRLSGQIVGLGNDIFSLGKDVATNQINLVLTLMHEELLTFERALEKLIRMHDRSLAEYDAVAAKVGSWGPEVDRVLQRWIEDVRYASLGFSLWEARAARYLAYKVVARGRVIEPSFDFFTMGDGKTRAVA